MARLASFSLLVLVLPLAAQESESAGNLLRRIGGMVMPDTIDESAVEKAEKRLATVRRVAKGDNDMVVLALLGVGRCRLDVGRGEEALAAFTEAFEMAKRLSEFESLPLQQSRFFLAQCHWRLGRSAEALRIVDEAIAALGDAAATGPNFVLWRLHGERATYLMDLDQPAQAERQLAELERDAEHLSMVDAGHLYPVLSNHALCLETLGRLEEAEQLHVRAWELVQAFHEGREQHPDLSTVLGNLAHCQAEQGKLLQALETYRRAQAAAEQTVPDRDHPAKAAAMLNVASTLERLGRAPEALAIAQDALAMLDRFFAGDHDLKCWAMDYLGGCLQELGRGDEALAMLRSALAMRRRLYPGDHRDTVVDWLHLGLCLFELRRDSEATDCYREALAMARRIDPEPELLTASALQNLAVLEGDTGALDDALQHEQAALAIFRRIRRAPHPAIADTLFGLAVIQTDRGEFAAAEANFAAAIAMGEACASGAVPQCRVEFGRMHLANGAPAKAAAVLAEAIVEIESRRRAAAPLDERDRALYFQQVRRLGPYALMVRAQLELGQPGKALEYLERSRGRSLLDLMERSRLDPLVALHTQAEAAGDAALLQRIEVVRRHCDETAAAADRLRRQLGNLHRRRDLDEQQLGALTAELRERLASALTDYRQATRERFRLFGEHVPMAQPASLTELRGMLAPGELLAYYSLGSDGGLMFLLSADRPEPEVHRLPAGRAAIEAAIADYLVLLHSGDTVPWGAAAAARGHRLFEQLVPTAASRRVLAAERVLVVPDGSMHRLPLEALVVAPRHDGQAERFWLDDGPMVAYGTSGTALLRCRERRGALAAAARGGIVALGDPVFAGGDADRRDAALAALAGTRTEVESIAAVFAQDAAAGRTPERVRTLLGEAATESALFAAAADARILHIATHHVVDEVDSSSYALALTPPAAIAPGDDGFVRVADLLERWQGRLSGCELVVLSACETQAGDAQHDEGIFGLPYGFLHAGAAAVLATQWPVADIATSELMHEFYRRLAASGQEAPLVAFTAARRALRAERPSPHRWAPFVFIGG